jgi:superfamily II DNA helicase RecQ
MDIQDIERVVQFMVPESLSIWTQQGGRAGRSSAQSLAILLVELSVFQLKKKKNTDKEKNAADDEDDEDNEDDEDDNNPDNSGSTQDLYKADLQYRKKVEGGVRRVIETRDCRRIESDRYFNNPKRTTGMYT